MVINHMESIKATIHECEQKMLLTLPVPGGPFTRVNPPSPYSRAAALIAASCEVLNRDFTQILKPIPRAFGPPISHRGPFHISCEPPGARFGLIRYFISGIFFTLQIALNSRNAIE